MKQFASSWAPGDLATKPTSIFWTPTFTPGSLILTSILETWQTFRSQTTNRLISSKTAWKQGDMVVQNSTEIVSILFIGEGGGRGGGVQNRIYWSFHLDPTRPDIGVM